MNFEFDKIIEGWKNHLLPPAHLKEVIKIVSYERLIICKKCEHNSINSVRRRLRQDAHCLLCGCTIIIKSKCLSCCCPDSRWTAVLSEDQEKEIEDEKRDSVKEDTT